jgi:ubiquitin carboxyl-terminal hydrolase 5/13
LVEEKIKCLATEKVKYTQRVDYIMQLPVPMDAALNKGRLFPQQGLGEDGG